MTEGILRLLATGWSIVIEASMDTKLFYADAIDDKLNPKFSGSGESPELALVALMENWRTGKR